MWVRKVTRISSSRPIRLEKFLKKLTKEQTEHRRVAARTGPEIDLTDIPEVLDWRGAEIGLRIGRMNRQSHSRRRPLQHALVIRLILRNDPRRAEFLLRGLPSCGCHGVAFRIVAQ